MSHGSDTKPLVVLLHGSSCGPEFTVAPDGSFHETSVFQDGIGGALRNVHVAVVVRGGVEPLTFSSSMTAEEKESAFERASSFCSDEYLRLATKAIRVDDVLAVIDALQHQPWVSSVVLAGHSEGTAVVTGVLRKPGSRRISAAGLFASAGPMGFFAGYAARGGASRDTFQEVFDQVRRVQQMSDDEMWRGLPGRRWKSFWLESTPIEDVRESLVPLFVAQGSDDGTTLAADLFALEAIRQQPKRSLRYVVARAETTPLQARTVDHEWVCCSRTSSAGR